MAMTPQRPFVPAPAPQASREIARPAEFKVAPPFVHAVASVARPAPPPLPLVYDPPVEPARVSGSSEPRVYAAEIRASRSEAETLAPIEQFLHTESIRQDQPTGVGEYAYETPGIEDFTDPAQDEGVQPAESQQGVSGELPDLAPEVSDEWGEAEWQQFDWRSAAALGEGSDPAASDAWLDTDWEKGPPRPREKRESAAKAIADALDGIARRIREGELAVPAPGSPTPADIAATLAALLGVKR